jgi:transposase InsO family protein
MRLRNLRAKQFRRFKSTTKRNKAHQAAPNRLQRDFETDRLDQKWLADITYIATLEGWLYSRAKASSTCTRRSTAKNKAVRKRERPLCDIGVRLTALAT